MKRNRRSILHVIDTTGPGGAETVFTQLAVHTKNQGYHSIALIRGPGWVAEELNRLGVETRVLNCKGSFNLAFLIGLINLIAKERINLIQSHLLGSAVYCSIAGIITGTPVISTFHGHVDISPDERFRWLKFWLIRKRSGRVVTVTQQLRNRLADIPAIADHLIDVIPNGVSTHTFQPSDEKPLRDQYGLSDSTIVLGCLGNVREAKNYGLAIDLVDILSNRGFDVRLFIAGDDKKPLAAEHKRYAASKNINDRIHWLGFYQDTPGFLNSIDCLVLTSSSEGHPLALTQAMACGTPIVATRCGVEEILEHGTTAMLAPINDAETLASHIMAIMSSQDLKVRITTNALREVTSSLSLSAMSERYVSIYEHLSRDGKPQRLIDRFDAYMANRYGGRRGYLRSLWHQFYGLWVWRYSNIKVQPERVVFVCKGNVCRSALAEFAFRKYSSMPAASIGLDTRTGIGPNSRISLLAKEFNIHLDSHKTTDQSDFISQPKDLFVCMEPGHLGPIKRIFKTDNVILLGLFGSPKRFYIHDPFVSSDQYTRYCAYYIHMTARNLANQLDVTNAANGLTAR